ncbi:MAG TPA: hypothetical protein VGE07_00120 [Herpetosiphonaceae bacterium]
MDHVVTADITAHVELCAGVDIVPADKLEVSLDCPGCGRIERTIIFHHNHDAAVCTPTRHRVAGRILERACSLQDGVTLVRYRITYPTDDFTDPKYHTQSVPHPTWARITARLRCPTCAAVTEFSTQNNAGRPWVRQCTCGHELLTETVENPQFRLFGPSGEAVYEHQVSTCAIWLDPAAPAAIIDKVARMLGIAPELISERAVQRQPIFEHHLFEEMPPHPDPRWPYQTFQEVAFLLLRTGVGFDIRQYGRSHKPSYEYRLRDAGDA